jgi:hypothetical protein
MKTQGKRRKDDGIQLKVEVFFRYSSLTRVYQSFFRCFIEVVFNYNSIFLLSTVLSVSFLFSSQSIGNPPEEMKFVAVFILLTFVVLSSTGLNDSNL